METAAAAARGGGGDRDRLSWLPPVEGDPDELCTVHASVDGGVGLGAWSMPASVGGARLLCLLAEWLQDALAESDVAWAQPRPPCPGHAHPSAPREIGAEAWWTCPTDDRALARIGTL